MFMLSALIRILALSIILILVLVVLVREENSAFGHAWSRGSGIRLSAARAA